MLLADVGNWVVGVGGGPSHGGRGLQVGGVGGVVASQGSTVLRREART